MVHGGMGGGVADDEIGIRFITKTHDPVSFLLRLESKHAGLPPPSPRQTHLKAYISSTFTKLLNTTTWKSDTPSDSASPVASAVSKPQNQPLETYPKKKASFKKSETAFKKPA